MNEEHARSEVEAYDNAAAALAAAVANLPESGHHHMMALKAQAEQDVDADQDFGAADGQTQARKPRKLRKPNDVARCQVDGCGRDLSDAKLYLRRYSVCEPHFKAEWVMLSGGRYRFCQQCNKFQPLDNFAGNRRSCKTRSEDRNLRRRKQRTDERAMAGDEADGMAGRLLKGGHHLGSLALPSRAALGDNGMLRQLGNDPNDPNNQLAAAQYANQVQQLLLAGGGGGGLGGQVQVQLPPGMDLSALGGLGGAAQNANALSLLTAAANGANRCNVGPLGSLTDTSGNSMLQQLQLAHLASALSKGVGGGIANGAINGVGGGMGGGGPGSLAAALGGMGMGMGLNGGNGGLGGGLHGGNLQQQLLLQQAATAAGGGGGGNMGNMGALSDAAGFGGNLDLQSLMAQQLLQQTATAGQGGPLLLLHNQNVMLLSLDQLGLLQQQGGK